MSVGSGSTLTVMATIGGTFTLSVLRIIHRMLVTAARSLSRPFVLATLRRPVLTGFLPAARAQRRSNDAGRRPGEQTGWPRSGEHEHRRPPLEPKVTNIWRPTRDQSHG